ncbi:MAG: hypothetical protein H6733_12175 [Alphaproteobacteria bacterium]|nr:hypothetical protein [Alphaproteobacteria bacterium]
MLTSLLVALLLPAAAVAQDAPADDAPATEDDDVPQPSPPPAGGPVIVVGDAGNDASESADDAGSDDVPEAPPPPAGGPVIVVGDSAPAAAPTPVKRKIAISTGPGGVVTVGDRLKLDFGGAIQYDLRFRPIKYTYGTWYDPQLSPRTISRNEVIGKFKLNARYGKFGGVADLDFAFQGYPKVDTLSDTQVYNQIHPFRFEAHELYAYAVDLFGLKGFDARFGVQKALFGVGDQFNPTNNVNPNDLEDVLLFGQQSGNLMVRLDYTPKWNWTLTGILVPVFAPSNLPDTAPLAQQTDRYPYTDPQTRYNLNVEQNLAAGAFTDGISLETYPTVIRSVAIAQPEFAPKNMQGFFRVGATLGGQDIALSYYRGFSDVPVPVANTTSQQRGLMCENPDDVDRPADERTSECIDGLLVSDATLTYPKMSVLGFNMTGDIGIGYRLEVGVYFPEQRYTVPITQDDVQFSAGPLGTITEDGPYEFPNGTDGEVVDTRPFAKWVLGIDYTFGKHVYLNAQWVHGFPDEFGAGDWIQEGYTVRGSGLREGASFNDCVAINFSAEGIGRTIDGTKCAREYLRPRLGDYLVLGLDFNFAAQRGLFRLFTIWDLIGVYEETWDPTVGERTRIWHHMFTPEGFSAVIYPDFRWKFGNGFELHLGALLQFGKPWSKFGSAETGGHQIWTRAKYSF